MQLGASAPLPQRYTVKDAKLCSSSNCGFASRHICLFPVASQTEFAGRGASQCNFFVWLTVKKIWKSQLDQ